MKKRKSSKKIVRKRKSKSTVLNSGYLPYLLSGLVTLLILFCFLGFYNRSHNPNVLSVATMLAKGGDHGGNPGEDVQQRKPPHLKLPENHAGQIENRQDDFINVEHATGSSGFVLRHKGVEAETENELRHDPTASNSLLLTTPSGNTHILILPDQAIQTVLTHNHLTSVLGEDGASSSADLESKIKLTIKGDQAVFEVKGIKKEKFLGFIPVNIHKTADVSASTGEVVSTSESFLGRLTDFLSF